MMNEGDEDNNDGDTGSSFITSLPVNYCEFNRRFVTFNTQ